VAPGIVLLLLGLGLFLFGLQVMTASIQDAVGTRVREVLRSLADRPLVAAGTGLVVTAVIQSSSATTVMVVGLVEAGLLDLRAAVAVILGANVGTTATGQLVAFSFTEYALPLVVSGAGLAVVFRGRPAGRWGKAVLGLGFVFLGLGYMSGGAAGIYRLPRLTRTLLDFSGSTSCALLAGMVVTGLLQSSSATTGITIVLAQQGFMDIKEAVAVVIGSNIGTCVTALLAAVGRSPAARQAAFAHLLINVGGMFLFLPFLGPFVALVQALGPDVGRQVANAHTIFNLVGLGVGLLLLNGLVKGVLWLVPGGRQGGGRRKN